MIRPIQDNATHFLADMLYEAIFVPEGHDPLPRSIIKNRSLSKYIDNWGKDKYDIALVAEENHQLIGAVWGRLLTKDSKGFGYVDNHTPELSIAIHSEHRNRGIGSELMNAIENAYKDIGVKHLSLSVDKANRASQLYLRLGYTIISETKTSWTMKKELVSGQ